MINVFIILLFPLQEKNSGIFSVAFQLQIVPIFILQHLIAVLKAISHSAPRDSIAVHDLLRVTSHQWFVHGPQL